MPSPSPEIEMTAGLARLWAITSYFNPAGFRRRRENYRVFRESLTVPLVTVEWALDGRFSLEGGDADVLIQAAGGDEMWHEYVRSYFATRREDDDVDEEAVRA